MADTPSEPVYEVIFYSDKYPEGHTVPLTNKDDLANDVRFATMEEVGRHFEFADRLTEKWIIRNKATLALVYDNAPAGGDDGGENIRDAPAGGMTFGPIGIEETVGKFDWEGVEYYCPTSNMICTDGSGRGYGAWVIFTDCDCDHVLAEYHSCCGDLSDPSVPDKLEEMHWIDEHAMKVHKAKAGDLFVAANNYVGLRDTRFAGRAVAPAAGDKSLSGGRQMTVQVAAGGDDHELDNAAQQNIREVIEEVGEVGGGVNDQQVDALISMIDAMDWNERTSDKLFTHVRQKFSAKETGLKQDGTPDKRTVKGQTLDAAQIIASMTPPKQDNAEQPPTEPSSQESSDSNSSPRFMTRNLGQPDVEPKVQVHIFRQESETEISIEKLGNYTGGELVFSDLAAIQKMRCGPQSETFCITTDPSVNYYKLVDTTKKQADGLDQILWESCVRPEVSAKLIFKDSLIIYVNDDEA